MINPYYQNPTQIPTGTTPNYTQQIIPQIQTQLSPNQLPSVGVYWVQGLEGAKGFQLTTANTSVYLRDSDDQQMLYIKSTDSNGRPGTLQAYRLEEVHVDNQTEDSEFITADILDQVLDEKLEKMFKKYIGNNKNQNRNNRNKNRNNRQVEEDYDETE